MQTRLLFLDFDGVLHPAGDEVKASQYFLWLDVLVRLLAPWPDVALAVHSTWRYDHTPDELRALLGSLGQRFIGAVPRGPRQNSIDWFLHLNPSFKNHLILDDAPQEFTSVAEERLVICDSRLGLSEPRVQGRILAWLNESAVQFAEPEPKTATKTLDPNELPRPNR